MDNFDDFDGAYTASKNFLQRLSPGVRAAVVLWTLLAITNLVNAITAGTALALTFPIVALIYTGCGALACKFANDDGVAHSPAHTGATAGMTLWGLSLITNLVIVGIVMGIFTLGITMVLGLPYLCFCAPVELIFGGLGGALGSVLYRKFFGDGRYSDGNFESW